MNRLASLGVFLFLSSVFVFVGCGPSGPKLYPVKGAITVNGKAAPQALVFFHRKGKTDINEPVPFGRATDDGKFSVTYAPGQGEGAQEGEYILTVVWPDMTKPEDSNGMRPDALRGNFDKVANSTLTATVKPEVNNLPPLDIKLSAEQAAKPLIKNPNDK